MNRETAIQRIAATLQSKYEAAVLQIEDCAGKVGATVTIGAAPDFTAQATTLFDTALATMSYEAVAAKAASA